MMTHWVERRARKPHRCCICEMWIRPGDWYQDGSGVDGDGWWRAAAHRGCMRATGPNPDGGMWSIYDLEITPQGLSVVAGERFSVRMAWALQALLMHADSPQCAQHLVRVQAAWARRDERHACRKGAA